jgi:succinyl-diaminopimelate desuccinylase
MKKKYLNDIQISQELSNEVFPELLGYLQKWVQINSVYDSTTITPTTPYGKGVTKALDYIYALAKSDGFDVKHYVKAVEINLNPEQEKSVIILGHADVVPVGKGWDADPFSGIIQNNRLYGRGSIDDKGPALAGYFAVKVLNKYNLLKNKYYRVVIGGDEERGSSCLDYYFNNLKKPHADYGFTPDAEFPLVYGEKGFLSSEYFGNIDDPRIIELHGGIVINAVIPEASAKIKLINVKEKIAAILEGSLYTFDYKEENDISTITIFGKAAHASTPELGLNAGAKLLSVLAQLLQTPKITHYANLFQNYDGLDLGVKCSDDALGALTMNLGLIDIVSQNYSFKINIRFPYEFIKIQGLELLKKNALDEYTLLTNKEPLYVDPNSDFIQTLHTSYIDITNDTVNKPMTIGGGTYAKNTKNAVAFGMLFPNEPELAHQINEYVDLDSLKKGLQIYILALLRLEKL